MARGITDYGYAFPALTEIIDETKESFKQKFGQDFNTTSNSISDKLINIFAEREYQLWLLGGAVYGAQTLQGAEGIYLDDLLGQRGIYRQGSTKATGKVQIELSKSVPYTTTYTTNGYTVQNDFVFQQDYKVAGNIAAQKILNSDLTVGTYIVSIVNTNSGSLVTQTYNLTNTAPNSAPLNAFLNGIKALIVNNTISSNSSVIQVNQAAGSIHIGFDSTYKLVGLNNNVDLQFSPQVGNKYVQFEVVANTGGELAVDAAAVNTISPTPVGMVSITNIDQFASGTNSETDAEYRARAAEASSSTGYATRPAVLSKLLNEVDGVRSVKIYSNPTEYTNSMGVPPHSFVPVVYGGTTEDISRALYSVIALSNNTAGDTFFDIPTEDGQVERIYHTKAEEVNIDVRITYSTVDGKELSASEKALIAEELSQFVSERSIAESLYNIQLVNEVVSAISNASRFSNLSISVKRSSEPDSAYVTGNFIPAISEVLILLPESVNFVQV